MYGYVYKITNKANDKIYVGQHKSDHFDERYFGGGVIITSAVNKYGKENFDREILEWCATKEELDTREIYWIQKLNARNPDTGYDISEGWEHGLAGCVKIIRGNDSMMIPIEHLEDYEKDGWITCSERNIRRANYNRLVNEITNDIMKQLTIERRNQKIYNDMPLIGKIAFNNYKSRKK